MTSASSLTRVIDLLERRYPPGTAEDWDAVGLVCGDPQAPVRRILWAVDPVEAVVDEAIDMGADLVITHHPLFLSGVHAVAATTAKGRVVHRLISAGIALYCAHTNADVADPGVSDALAATVGLTRTRPVVPPGRTADPEGIATGLGRIGELEEPTTLADFAARVAEALPPTRHGVRVAGDPGGRVHRVAVCGGSGDSLLAIATDMGADVLVTADLKHHRALEHLEEGGCAIIDVAHWASEWPWLEQAAQLLDSDLAREGTTVVSVVSAQPTDPWSMTLRSEP
ncbi:MAG: Nif3-like dinuclear metal center hexameric protein [Candidatus Nanopelagicales bacterium]